MKFVYSTTELEPYNFAPLGGKLHNNTVHLTDDAYQRFLYETENTGHSLTLAKETDLESLD